MGWKVIKTEDEYNIASSRLMDIFNAKQGTAEGDELELLIILIKDFDNKHYILKDIN